MDRSQTKSNLFKKFLISPTNTENLKQIFPEKELGGYSPNCHIHVFVSDLYIPMIYCITVSAYSAAPILGIYKSLTDTWNVEIGTEAEQFPEKEYIKWIFVVVLTKANSWSFTH